MIKKESRQFNISVEGINCEKMYFEHLSNFRYFYFTLRIQVMQNAVKS